MEQVRNHFEQTMVARIISEQLTDEDIFYLLDQFLRPGMHYVRVHSVEQGKHLLRSFIRSVNLPYKIASISATKSTIIGNIFDEIKNLSSYEEYIAENLDADIIIIEATENLQNLPWVSHFIQTLLDFKLDEQMPIILYSFSENPT